MRLQATRILGGVTERAALATSTPARRSTSGAAKPVTAL